MLTGEKPGLVLALFIYSFISETCKVMFCYMNINNISLVLRGFIYSLLQASGLSAKSTDKEALHFVSISECFDNGNSFEM